MRFNSESERMEHDEASLIPRYLWHEFFDGELTELQIELMRTVRQIELMPAQSSEELNNILEQLTSQENIPTKNKQGLWASIILASNSSMPNDMLVKFAKKLKLSESQSFFVAGMLGNVELLKKLVTSYPDKLEAMLAAGNYRLLCRLAEKGDLTMIKDVMELAPSNVHVAMIEAEDDSGLYAAVCKADENDHKELADYLISMLTNSEQEQVRETIRINRKAQHGGTDKKRLRFYEEEKTSALLKATINLNSSSSSSSSSVSIQNVGLLFPPTPPPPPNLRKRSSDSISPDISEGDSVKSPMIDNTSCSKK